MPDINESTVENLLQEAIKANEDTERLTSEQYITKLQEIAVNNEPIRDTSVSNTILNRRCTL